PGQTRTRPDFFHFSQCCVSPADARQPDLLSWKTFTNSLSAVSARAVVRALPQERRQQEAQPQVTRTQEAAAMFFLTRPSRPVRPQLEQLDNRLVLTAFSSAISIPHNGWVERDWYSFDSAGSSVSDGSLVEFQGTSRHNLDVPMPYTQIPQIRASVDPN